MQVMNAEMMKSALRGFAACISPAPPYKATQV
jgi:hypothetical protein